MSFGNSRVHLAFWRSIWAQTCAVCVSAHTPTPPRRWVSLGGEVAGRGQDPGSRPWHGPSFTRGRAGEPPRRVSGKIRLSLDSGCDDDVGLTRSLQRCPARGPFLLEIKLHLALPGDRVMDWKSGSFSHQQMNILLSPLSGCKGVGGWSRR